MLRFTRFTLNARLRSVLIPFIWNLMINISLQLEQKLADLQADLSNSKQEHDNQQFEKTRIA